MNALQQKHLLAFLRKVEEKRKHEKSLEKAVQLKQPGDARKHANELVIINMTIDNELKEAIAICRVEQLTLPI